MKYTKALIITVLISTMSCKKTDYTFSTSEITETDINGNLTGNININDWKLLPLSSATELAQPVNIAATEKPKSKTVFRKKLK